MEEIKDDLKRKDWVSPDWMKSKDALDRLIWFVSSLSPHNLWKAREAIRDYTNIELSQSNASLIAEIEALKMICKAKSHPKNSPQCNYFDHNAALDDVIALIQKGEHLKENT